MMIGLNTFAENQWICTDADNEQYCMKISEDIFIYKEAEKSIDENGKTVISQTSFIEEKIDFRKLSSKQIEDSISPYYSSLEELKEIYSDDWKQIIVECYFEQEFAGY